jgi:hypothetical protein
MEFPRRGLAATIDQNFRESIEYSFDKVRLRIKF